MWFWNQWFPRISDSLESLILKFWDWVPFFQLIFKWIWNTHLVAKRSFGPKIVQFWPNLSSICMVTQARFLSFVNCIVFQIENCWNHVVRNLILVENNSPKIMESVIPGYQWFPSTSDSKTTWVPFQKFWNRWCPRISDSLESLIPFPDEDTVRCTIAKSLGKKSIADFFLWNQLV